MVKFLTSILLNVLYEQQLLAQWVAKVWNKHGKGPWRGDNDEHWYYLIVSKGSFFLQVLVPYFSDLFDDRRIEKTWSIFFGLR